MKWAFYMGTVLMLACGEEKDDVGSRDSDERKEGTEQGDCLDGLDNDGDGLIDCEDDGCSDKSTCEGWEEPEEVELEEVLDSDGDGYPDDEDCAPNDAAVNPEASEILGNDVDDDCDGAVDETALEAGTDCWDGLDNDADGFLDCDDPDCSVEMMCETGALCDDSCATGTNNGICEDGGANASTMTCGLGTDCSDCGIRIDADGDLHAADPSGMAFRYDCDDSDPNVNISATEVQGNGVDDDCDGIVDETALETGAGCRDGLDNDADGLADCADPNCFSSPLCQPEPVCNDGLDNDEDGLTDCFDSDCFSAAVCLPEPVCNDGIDNDEDGLTDCFDSDCTFSVVCQPEATCDDGLDNDEDGLTDCFDSDCDVEIFCQPEVTCDDGLDNDLDGQTDCADLDCDGVSIFDASGIFGECQPGIEKTCGDQFDNDADGVMDCADSDCQDVPICQSESACNDGMDNDLDGFLDCNDTDCAASCFEADCANGLDDDGDSLSDCADQDCTNSIACGGSGITEVDCENGQDDDNDGLSDCADQDCLGELICSEWSICNDLCVDPSGAGLIGANNGICEDAGENSSVSSHWGSALYCDLGTDCTDCGVRIDRDQDGYAEDPSGTAIRYDCDDSNPSVHSEASELLGNGLDDDCDGTVDITSTYELDCDDGFDEDGDGFFDCNDADCATDSACSAGWNCDTACDTDEYSLENCFNGQDDDGDGWADCDDSDCADAEACVESICDDGLDNDGDGFIDCQDAECSEDSACLNEMVGLTVRLEWTQAGDDLDLHLLRAGGALGSLDDCYYQNCLGTFRILDWGVSGVAEDNPVLVLDDIPGTGPEEIQILAPQNNGEFTVVVHDYPSSVYQGSNIATVTIFYGSTVLWQGDRAITGEDSYTNIASIAWNTLTVTPM